MAVEIERKFLVTNDDWRTVPGNLYRQGYIPTTNETTVRVRVAGEQGYLTLKGKTTGRSRSEFEYPIPLADANQMLDTLCVPPLIEKIRHRLPLGEVVWEIDEFSGDNHGLIIAEVELLHEDQKLELPSWIGEEVTHDLRYFNVNLAKHPFSQWKR
jgi:adenylate cyclase